MSSSYRIELDNWLRQLDVKADRVFDIGGSQLPIKGRTKSWHVNKYTIADLPQPHIGSPKPEIELDLNSSTVYPIGIADLVFCLEVFDYVWNPAHAMYILSRIMAPGSAWVTFPFIYPTHQPIEDDALRYTEFGIKKLATSVDLNITQMIKRRPETDAIEQLWRRERMRAAKGYDHDFTGWIVEFQK